MKLCRIYFFLFNLKLKADVLLLDSRCFAEVFGGFIESFHCVFYFSLGSLFVKQHLKQTNITLNPFSR